MRNVLLRTSSRTTLLIDQPSRTNRSARSSSSSGCEGRSPSAPKLSTEGDESAAEDVVPDAVHRDPCRQRVGRIGDPPGEIQSPAAGGPGRMTRGRSRGPRASGGARPDRRSSGCHEGRRVRPRASPRSWPGRAGDRGVGLSISRKDSSSAPSRPVAAASSSSNPRSRSHASRRGPGLGVGSGRAMSRRPAPRAIRTRRAHNARRGARRIDRRVSEQADRRHRRGQGRRALIREAGHLRRRRIHRDRNRPAGPCRGGLASWCPRTRGSSVGLATSPDRTCASEGCRRSGSTASRP